jgi:hypothetical protein
MSTSSSFTHALVDANTSDPNYPVVLPSRFGFPHPSDDDNEEEEEPKPPPPASDAYVATSSFRCVRRDDAAHDGPPTHRNEGESSTNARRIPSTHCDDGESSTNSRRTMMATSPLSCQHERVTHNDGDAARDGPSTHRDEGEL